MAVLMSSHDERVAAGLEELTSRKARGDPLDLDAVARQHPDLIDEVRQLLAVADIAGEFAGPDGQATPPTLAPRMPSSPSPLPRRFGDYELLQELGRGGM